VPRLQLESVDDGFGVTADIHRTGRQHAGRGTDGGTGGMVPRPEGWAAGLRLAALSLAGHPDPERFAAEFSGSERTVAEYLLAEVLDRRPEEVRRLLLRTSILERVNGELADLLTGDADGERILQDLEQANAFVVSLDAARTWFRYHQMFASLLALELRRTAPKEVTRLHQAASSWFAAHQFPVEAIRHAQTARDWEQGIALAHRIGRPFPEFTGLGHLAAVEVFRSHARAAVRTIERLAGLVAAPSPVVTGMRAFQAHILTLLGETRQAEDVLAGLGEQERDGGEIRVATAGLWLAQDDPNAAAAVLAPVLDGSAPLIWPNWLVQAFLLHAITQDALGDAAAADRALERALEQAEPDGALFPFLLCPAPNLLERAARGRTAHAALIAEIRSLLAGTQPVPPLAGPPPSLEPLSTSELRVLRYLSTNLTAPEIAGELCVSRHTVKSHMRNLYAKLGTHRRTETVARARDLRLLTPGGHRVARSESSQP
jgi:DNA-binding CsgD family transcriptional regulator